MTVDTTTKRFTRERLLGSVRVVWMVVVGLAVGLFVACVPAFYRQMLTLSVDLGAGVPSEALRVGLEALNLSPRFYAAYGTAILILFGVVYVVVGVLIFWRKLDEWMPLFVSLWLALFGLTFTPVTWSVAELLWQDGSWSQALVWVLEGFTSFSFVSFFLLLYLFPDGQFVPRWTRWPAALFAVLAVVPDFAAGSFLDSNTWPPLLNLGTQLLLFATMVYAQVYRYRYDSHPLQRQQTKWVVFGLSAAIVGFFLAIASGELFPALKQPGAIALGYDLAFGLTLVISFLLIPLSIAASIFRYRLYDIDLLINKTLVYSALTVALALAYFGSVVLFQQVLNPLTASSDFAIIVSTLTIAALFNPLRQRIQDFIDRRFYRRKYDAQQVLAAFGQTVREEVELDSLTGELLAVIEETMQHEHISLWLREPEIKQ
ncbi:MAG: hypothetical protein M3220_04045 [Chloroflexota bacterium]|nr:hypothetical protein [Chloroflexota bacterium]